MLAPPLILEIVHTKGILHHNCLKCSVLSKHIFMVSSDWNALARTKRLNRDIKSIFSRPPCASQHLLFLLHYLFNFEFANIYHYEIRHILYGIIRRGLRAMQYHQSSPYCLGDLIAFHHPLIGSVFPELYTAQSGIATTSGVGDLNTTLASTNNRSMRGGPVEPADWWKPTFCFHSTSVASGECHFLVDGIFVILFLFLAGSCTVV